MLRLASAIRAPLGDGELARLPNCRLMLEYTFVSTVEGITAEITIPRAVTCVSCTCIST